MKTNLRLIYALLHIAVRWRKPTVRLTAYDDSEPDCARLCFVISSMQSELSLIACESLDNVRAFQEMQITFTKEFPLHKCVWSDSSYLSGEVNWNLNSMGNNY